MKARVLNFWKLREDQVEEVSDGLRITIDLFKVLVIGFEICSKSIAIGLLNFNFRLYYKN